MKHIVLSRDNLNLTLDALVVNDLDVDILAGIPFMALNDISVRPAKQQIMIGDTNTVHYGTSDTDNHNRVRRAHAYVLKPETTSVVWPGGYVELALPSDLQPECTLAIESRSDNYQPTGLRQLLLKPSVGKSVYLMTPMSPCPSANMIISVKFDSPQNFLMTLKTITFSYRILTPHLKSLIQTPCLLTLTKY